MLLEKRKPVHIGEQQLRALMLLVARAGELVSRQQLRQELWPDGIHVDFEGGLYTCMRRLRQALRDGATGEHYVATVPGAGYRFGAAVEWLPEQVQARPRRVGRWGWAAGLAAAWLLAVGWLGLRSAPAAQVVSVQALTTDGGMDVPLRPASDGRQLYYLERAGAGWDLMRNSGDPATAQPMPPPFAHMRVFDIAGPGQQWLLGSFRARGRPNELWTAAGPGHAPQRAGALAADDALWDGSAQRIIFASQNALWSARVNGADLRRLATVPGRVSWMAWSPDKRRLRFTVNDSEDLQSLWEWQPGSLARRLQLGGAGPACCGSWTGDGRYFVYSALRGGAWNLWAVRARSHLSAALDWPRSAPFRLTATSHPVQGGFTGYGNHQVVFYESVWREDLQQVDARTGRAEPLLPGRFAAQLQYSRDARSVVYVDTRDRSVWTAEVLPGLGAARLRRLSPPGATTAFPRWSPDGRSVAFASQRTGEPLRVVRATVGGGTPLAVVLPAAWAGADAETPDWSPDGQRLVIALERHIAPGINANAIAVLAADGSGELQVLPGSEGLAAARWSPDGRLLAAFSSDQRQLRVYSFAQRLWQTVAAADALSIPEWSRDGRYLYFQDLIEPGQPIYRLARPDWRRERVTDFAAALQAGVHRCGFIGLAPDGAALVSFNRSSADLFAAELRLP
ncbi:MAG: winged helix-turn-helix domain-containing protein [Terriglobales bacterium]